VMVGGVVELTPLLVVVGSLICTGGVVEAEFCVTDSGGFDPPRGALLSRSRGLVQRGCWCSAIGRG